MSAEYIKSKKKDKTPEAYDALAKRMRRALVWEVRDCHVSGSFIQDGALSF